MRAGSWRALEMVESPGALPTAQLDSHLPRVCCCCCCCCCTRPCHGLHGADAGRAASKRTCQTTSRCTCRATCGSAQQCMQRGRGWIHYLPCGPDCITTVARAVSMTGAEPCAYQSCCLQHSSSCQGVSAAAQGMAASIARANLKCTHVINNTR
jgi:hypothetical protein